MVVVLYCSAKDFDLRGLLSLECRLLCKLDFADAKFSLYFLGYYPAEAVPDDPQERVSHPTYTCPQYIILIQIHVFFSTN